MPRHVAAPLTPEQVAEARALWEGGWSAVRVASRFGVSEPFLRKFVPVIHRRPVTVGSNQRRARLSRRLAEQSHEVAR